MQLKYAGKFRGILIKIYWFYDMIFVSFLKFVLFAEI